MASGRKKYVETHRAGRSVGYQRRSKWVEHAKVKEFRENLRGYLEGDFYKLFF